MERNIMNDTGRYRRPTFFQALASLALAGAFLVACDSDDGEDRPGVEVIDSDSGTGTGSDPGSVSGSGSGSGTGAGVEPGVVEEPPEGATRVDVRLGEWSVEPSAASVTAGQVYFLVENAGPDDPHEFVVIRTDEAPDALPVVEGRVPEDEVDIVDEIEPFAPNSSASITLDLEPGNYVFICNVAEVEEGELESHYQLGMRVAFEVTE
jgi:uncharacterized cupredoxin-like copper-binding protein